MLSLKKSKILGFEQTFCTLEDATDLILGEGTSKKSRYFCISNTYQIVLGVEDSDFAEVINGADNSIADSAVLGLCGKFLGDLKAPLTPFRGYDLLLSILAAAESRGVNVGFYGGTELGIQKLVNQLKSDFPALQATYAYSPPFRKLSDEELECVVEDINNAQVDVLLVGIGCPKQERFMFDVSNRVDGAAMVGIGAAFDFYTGDVEPSPSWVHKSGLEWLYRLISEPRRLFKRYALYNSKFVFYFAGQLIKRIYKIGK
jgi:N-acetylglucosaminyldiphosphoundecaprenol N-acetyl-beta-D-mannosaminyltransferase